MRKFLLLCCLLGPAVAAPVDFQRAVRSILSNNCFACHGPDKDTRMAGLRLDLKEEALAPRKNGAAIGPGSPEKSRLYQRITAESAARRMPPAYSHKTLTEEQKETLRRWIAEGAPWQQHWSFVAPVRPAGPAVKTKGWARNPIDAFILARLEAEGLKPAPEADRRTLIRRVSLDLTGLPPTPEEVEAFVGDRSKNAYEKVVDRLLASPHWGEHRARYWLDAARYADTHGIHVDNYREMWPYRDWVINAFNRNLSFDRFTIEQLAGDLIPNRTLDQQIATGFHRCNVTTNEAGIIEAEFDAIYAKDRVDTTGAVWLGLTVGCATCHDHKFDPISQRDFYSMAAFFRNTTQPIMDGNAPDTPPIVVVPNEEDRGRWSELIAQEAELRRRMQERRGGPDATFDAWLAAGEHKSLAMPLEAASQTLALSFGQDLKLATGGSQIALPLPDGVTLGPASDPGRKALHFAKESSLPLPNADISSDQPFAVAAWIYFPPGDDSFTVASQSNPEEQNRGWAIDIQARVAGLRLTAGEKDTIQVRAGHLEQLKPGTWNHLAVSYDGSREQLGLALYLNGRAVPTQGAGDQNTHLSGGIRTDAPLRLGREGRRYFAGGALADFRVFNRAISEEEARLISLWPVIEGARAKAAGELTAAEREALHLVYLNRRDAAYREQDAQLRSLLAERRAIRDRGAITLVMEERQDSTPMAHILYRGQYDQPREAVEPNVPAALPPMAASLPRNRMGLARWLVDPANPLTARVTVNRFWQEVFGTGIVKTAEDFGSQGQPPSHPELLDWLAVEFRESGWDVKRFFRLLVTSTAYRQSAATTPEKLSKDPDNRLLARGPRFRMDGEMVRDYALAASGLLAPLIGGPSVKPYQPEGVWEAVAMVGSNTRFYHQDSGESLYRRSLYTFWKRAAPPASMEIFNAPTRETCTVRRERTDTPLQALVTMNDPQFVEAARHLAGRAMEAAPQDLDRQIDFLTARLLARSFDEKERDVTRRAYADYLRYYDAHPEDASKLLAVGESPADSALPAAEYAAMTMVANQVMNLDEVLNK